ncbi:LPXTG-domain-containing protein cell wall anchor domain [Enterococcus caccae]|nr:LPXTG-domain-containing protein cell wall anchor domain [Enterococcus caccae]
MINGRVAFAQEGAEVPTKGEIVLFDDETSSSSQPPPSSSSENVTKPKGRFPSTGELVKYGVSIGGSLLLLLVIFLYLLRKRDRNKGKEQ